MQPSIENLDTQSISLETEPQKTAHINGGVNVSFHIVAVNNAGKRSDPAFGEHTTRISSK